MTFGPCHTNGDCCGPGSYCCAHTGPHTHDDTRADAIAAYLCGLYNFIEAPSWEINTDATPITESMLRRAAALPADTRD